MFETFTIRISPTIQAVRINGELVELLPEAVETITQVVVESVIKLEEPNEELASWAKNWRQPESLDISEPHRVPRGD